VNDEFERMWKEVVMAYLKALSEHSFAGTEETERL
jgi:hypothetical protein